MTGVPASCQRSVASSAVVVREPRLAALLRQIKKRGLVPRLHFSTNARSPYRTNELSDYDTLVLAQLYYAARLNHELSDRPSAAYRLPYSILLDLEAQITPHDRDLADELAREAARQLTTHKGRQTANGAWQLEPIRDSSAVVRRIEEAILANSPLTITYYAATYYQVTARAGEPPKITIDRRQPHGPRRS